MYPSPSSIFNAFRTVIRLYNSYTFSFLRVIGPQLSILSDLSPQISAQQFAYIEVFLDVSNDFITCYNMFIQDNTTCYPKN